VEAAKKKGGKGGKTNVGPRTQEERNPVGRRSGGGTLGCLFIHLQIGKMGRNGVTTEILVWSGVRKNRTSGKNIWGDNNKKTREWKEGKRIIGGNAEPMTIKRNGIGNWGGTRHGKKQGGRNDGSTPNND